MQSHQNHNIRRLIFVTGGARSGKSSFALREASGTPGRKAYIATAEPLDEEMHKRIEAHKKERGKDWDTYEEPVKIAELLTGVCARYNVILLDCLTMWLSNIMHRTLNITNAITDLKSALSPESNMKKISHLPPIIYLVSNEVGLGIVPGNEMARKFRDVAGILNQEIAGIADEVYMVVSGIPVRIK